MPRGRSLKCPRCECHFTAPRTGTMRPPAWLPPPMEFGLWNQDQHPRPSEEPAPGSVRRRFPKRAILAGAALLLAFLLGAAAANALGHKPPSPATSEQPPAPPRRAVTAPTPPAPPPPKPTAPKPPDPPPVQTAPPPTKQLIIGRWQGRYKVPELRRTVRCVMTFEKDGTFSMQFAHAPNAPAVTSSQQQRFRGVYKFRSPTVADFEWKNIPREIDVGVTTCTIHFVDRDLLILTSVLNGEKRELRRIDGSISSD